MTKPMTSVLADALRLDDDARAALAAELLASLDRPDDPDATQAWDAEIERRIEAIEAGRIALEPWDEVKIRIHETCWAGEPAGTRIAACTSWAFPTPSFTRWEKSTFTSLRARTTAVGRIIGKTADDQAFEPRLIADAAPRLRRNVSQTTLVAAGLQPAR
jgi:putative addiction module component (TIGR02574 family)